LKQKENWLFARGKSLFTTICTYGNILDFVADVHAVKNKKDKIEEVIKTVGLTPERQKKSASYQRV
jgi:ABC-type multidrug transport system ATPase subunit